MKPPNNYPHWLFVVVMVVIGFGMGCFLAGWAILMAVSKGA